MKLHPITTAVSAFILAALPLHAALEQQPSNVVQLLTSSPQLLVPVAGAAQGANGTFFRSDISVLNLSNHEQRVSFRWLPQGGVAAPSVDITIPAHTGLSSEDFVTRVMHEQGIGSIIISAADTNDQLDMTGALYATSRIWTEQPGSDGGTTSQSFNVLSLVGAGTTTNTNLGSIFGIHRDTRYRANVGIVNISNESHTFLVTVVLPPSPPDTTPPPVETYTVTIGPLSMQQIALTAGSGSPSQIVVQRTTSGTGTWTAYGSSVDNVTGDSWSELLVPSAQ